MNFKIMTILLLGSLITSCSIKKDEEAPVESEASVRTQTQIPKVLDQDKDGLSDALERQLGRETLTGNFPSFSIGNFNFTEIEIRDFSSADNDLKVNFSLDKETGRELNYNPIQDKMAKASYQRLVGQPINPDPINLYDLGVVKLSNFSHVDVIKLKNYIFLNSEDLETKAVRIQSRLFLDVNSILGIKKIFNLKIEVGFVSGNGAFASFGGVQDLIGVDRTRISFNSRGDTNSARSNTEVMVYLDRLPFDTLNLILDNEYDLALKIVDYKAELADGSLFTYSTQLSEASTAGSLFAISTPEVNTLFFNARKEPISETLKRFFKTDSETDGEGTILGVGPMARTTSQPVIFEEGGNSHLEGKDWYLFSENNKITDTPRMGESVMLGYFQNSNIAKSSNRLIQVRDESFSSKSITRDITGLNLGETVSIEISGENSRTIGNSPERIVVWATGTEHGQLCVRDPNCNGGGGGGHFLTIFQLSESNVPFTPISNYSIISSESEDTGDHVVLSKEDSLCLEENFCALGNKCLICHYPRARKACYILWVNTTTNTSPLNLYKNKQLSAIKFFSEKNSVKIPLTDTSFFKKNLPIRILENGDGSWKFEFKIDKEFLLKHGERISFEIPREEHPTVEHGLHTDQTCSETVRNLTFDEPGVRRMQTDGDVQRKINIKIKRSFN